jgi:hypothetical protein
MMNTKHFLTALAGTSLIVGGSALAQGRGNGHSGASAVAHGKVGHKEHEAAVRVRHDARVNSQGPAHANDRARARANDHSVLAIGRATTDLSSLRTGLIVRDRTGASLGTIARINRASDGRIVNVLVRDASGRGRTTPVAPNTLSISGDVVTTTAIRRK